MRTLLDATHDNVSALIPIATPGTMIAVYGTGSPDIEWTRADREEFPGHVEVIIDQGFTDSPLVSATVRDVERGAWSAGHAVRAEWVNPRKTIYCSRSVIPELQTLGWKGDVWLASPGPMPTMPPHYDGINVVAQQYGFHTRYDVSTVFDANWPLLPGAGNFLSVTPHPGYANFGWPLDLAASASELLVVGAGGKGTGTSHVDIITKDHHAEHVPLAPGIYIAHVRSVYGSHVGDWSPARKFTGIKP